MRTLGLLARVELTSALRRAARTLREEKLKVRVVAVLGGAIWAGVLAGLLAGLGSLEEFPAFKGLVVSHLLGMFFFVIMAMLFFSSTVVSYGALFAPGEVAFLLAGGVRPADVYSHRLWQAVLFSGWATAVMGLPVVIAYGIDAGARWYYYPLAAAALGPFILLPAAAGGLVALACGRYIARYRRALVAASVLAGALGTLYAAMTLPVTGAGRDYAEEWLFRILGWFAFSRRPWYPSAWMSRALEALTAGDLRGWLGTFYALAAGAVFLLQAGRLAASVLMRRAYEEVGSLSARRESRWNRPLWLLALLLARGRRRPAAVIYKDLALFLRDPLQWGQAAVFLGLILIYFVGLKRFSGAETGRHWRLATVELSFLSVILTVSTFTTRFGFPLVSMEVRPPWVLVSGLRARALLRAKTAWTGVLVAAVTVGLLSVGAASLRMSAAETAITAAAAAGAAVALAAGAVSLGALFPERGRRTPSEMVSSFGGTMTLLLSLLVVCAYGLSYHLCIKEWVYASVEGEAFRPGAGRLVPAVAFLLAAGPAAAWVAVRAGERALERMEWT